MSPKSINELSHELIGAQLLTYLRLGKFPLGLLINFNVRKLVDGVERVSNDAPNLSAPSAPSAFQNPSA